MSKNAIIGAIDLYGWDKVKHWANSIKQSGFTGDVHLIVFRVDQEVLDKAKEYGFQVWQVGSDNFGMAIQHNVMGRDTVSHQLRFWAIWSLLQLTEQYRRIIITDVRDVIFQRNPDEYLEKYDRGYGISPSEGILFKDEPWNTDNVAQAFGPAIASSLQHKTVCNVGTIAGTHDFMKELALIIYLMGVGHQIPNDQAAFNVLTHGLLKSRLQVTPMSSGWACQCAMMFEPSRQNLKPFLIEDIPVIKDGKFYTSTGEEFVIVHQYDRIPDVAPTVEKLYE
jgi:hypothetical protein